MISRTKKNIFKLKNFFISSCINIICNNNCKKINSKNIKVCTQCCNLTTAIKILNNFINLINRKYSLKLQIFLTKCHYKHYFNIIS